MATASGLSKLVKGGFVQFDPGNPKPKVVVFQYNPETLVRRLDSVSTAVLPQSVPLQSAVATAPAQSAPSAFLAQAKPAPDAMPAKMAPAALPATQKVAPAPSPAPVASTVPRDLITFTLALDAADKLEMGDSLTQQSGLLPTIAALELLLYPAQGSLLVWVSGSRRVVPVRLTEMQIVEQAFDPALNPIRAEVAITLLVLKDADLANDPHGKALWDVYFAILQQLAQTVYDSGSLAALGLTAI